MFAKCRRDLFALVFPQQSCVHEHRHQLIANRLVHQRRRYRRVHAAGDRRQHALISNLCANSRHRIFDDRGRRPFGFDLANINREVFEQFDSIRRVVHFGMELHAEIFSREIAHRREGTVPRFRQRDESLGHARDAIPMRHPNFRQHVQHRAGDQRLNFCGSIFAVRGRVHLSAERVGERLHPIANAEDGKSRFQDEILNVWRASLVDGFRSAGEDESLRLDGKDFFLRRVPREQLAIDLRLAHAARDQLGVLGTEIEDGEGVCHQCIPCSDDLSRPTREL